MCVVQHVFRRGGIYWWRRRDLITGWVMRLKAARGRGAAVAIDDHDTIVASGLRTEDFAKIDRTIAALDRQVRSNVLRKKALGCSDDLII